MQNSTDCHLFPPQAKLCGEFGNCIFDSQQNTSLCACQPGYTSFGDFSLDARNPCDINREAVLALWIVVLITLVFALCVAIWGIYARRKAGLVQWRAWRMWSVPYLVIVQTCFLFAICICKFIETEPSFNLGSDAGMTTLHALTCIMSITCFSVAIGGISHLTGEADIRTRSASAAGGSGTIGAAANTQMGRVFWIDVFITVTWTICAVVCLMPYISVTDPSLVWLAAGLHGCGFALQTIILSQVAVPQTIDLLIEQLSDSVKTTNVKRNQASIDKMNRVLLKLHAAKQFFRLLLPIGSVLVIIVCVWPFLVVKIAYFLPLLWISIEILLAGVVWVTTTTSNNMTLRRMSGALLTRLRSVRESGIRTRRSVESLGELTATPQF